MTVETLTRTNVKQAVPFFNVTDIKASLRFYVDGIGFHMTNQWIDKGKLTYEYNLFIIERTRISSSAPLPTGKVRIEVKQRYALRDAADAHRDLEARRTSGSTILTV